MSTTFVADIDLDGEPYIRRFVIAETEDAAREQAEADLDKDETVGTVKAFPTIGKEWEERIAAGHRVTASFKSENGTESRPVGPMFLTDHTEAEQDEKVRPVEGRNGAASVVAVPFGYRPSWEERLPWMARSDAKRIAKALGLTLGES